MKRKSETVIDHGLKSKKPMLARKGTVKKAELSDDEEDTDDYIFEDLNTDNIDEDESDDEYIFVDLPTDIYTKVHSQDADSDENSMPSTESAIENDESEIIAEDILKDDEKEECEKIFNGQADEINSIQSETQESENVMDDPTVKQECVGNEVNEEHMNGSIADKRKKKTWKPDLSKLLNCDECDHRTPYKSNLNLHKKNVHDQVTNMCSYCNKEFKHLKVHIDTVHEKTQRLQCEQCEFVCYKKAGLRSHIRRRHTDYYVRHTCPFCFRKVEHLEIHIKKVHENPEKKERLVKCEECPYATTSKNNLLSHTLNSHKIVKMNCTICNAEINKIKRSAHMKKHLENQFSCDLCAKTYREKRDLAGHILYVHKEKRNTCNYCEKKVTNLRMHVKWQHKDVDPLTVDISGDLEMIYRIKTLLGESCVYSGELENLVIGTDDLQLKVADLSGMVKDENTEDEDYLNREESERKEEDYNVSELSECEMGGNEGNVSIEDDCNTNDERETEQVFDFGEEEFDFDNC